MKRNSFFKQEAISAYNKLTRGFFNFFSLSKEPLKNFFQYQKEKNAFTQFHLGIREVPLDKIRGSVQKNSDFNIDFIPINPVTESRWCAIYEKYLEDGNLPLVSLYKIRDDYFVYDGNHRISVAKYLNFNSIEANVTEFMPNTLLDEDVVYNERFFFEKQTGLTGIDFAIVGGYEKLLKDMENYRELLHLNSESFSTIAASWKKNLFNPVTKLFHLTDLFHDIPNGHLYLKVIDYLSQNPESGYLQSTLEVMDFYDIYISENIKRQFNKLDYVDSKREKNLHLTDKINALEKFVGIDMKFCLKIIREIELTELKKEESDIHEIIPQIKDMDLFLSKLDKWHSERFIFRYSLIEQRVAILPEKYRKSFVLLDNPERLTLEFIKYEKIFQNRYPFKLTDMEVVFNYIIEVYIPIIDAIHRKGHIGKLYYPISKRYRRIHHYKKKSNIQEAINLVRANKNYSKYFYSTDDEIYNY